MKRRWAHRLTALYPSPWRRRYRREFEDLLEAHPLTLCNAWNVVAWAVYERTLCSETFKMDPRQRSLTLMTFSYLAAVAAGINLYWTVADTPLASARHSHAALLATWNVVQGASILAFAAVALIGIRVFCGIRRSGLSTGTGVLGLLAVPLSAALVTFVWLGIGAIWAQGRWVPTPWDIAGDWTAPSGWPPLSTRWALGSVTFAILVGGLAASAISLKQVIRRIDLSSYARLWFTAPLTLFAGSVAVMLLGVLAWGWYVQQYAAVDFHVRNGGLFSSTNFFSWAASCVVFLAATLVAVQGVRSAWPVRTESCGDGRLLPD
jgi:hypothetical protein